MTSSGIMKSGVGSFYDFMNNMYKFGGGRVNMQFAGDFSLVIPKDGH